MPQYRAPDPRASVRQSVGLKLTLRVRMPGSPSDQLTAGDLILDLRADDSFAPGAVRPDGCCAQRTGSRSVELPNRAQRTPAPERTEHCRACGRALLLRPAEQHSGRFGWIRPTPGDAWRLTRDVPAERQRRCTSHLTAAGTAAHIPTANGRLGELVPADLGRLKRQREAVRPSVPSGRLQLRRWPSWRGAR